MVHGDFERGFIADLNRNLLLSACPRSASHNSVNTRQNENRFLAFGSLTSSAKVENEFLAILTFSFIMKSQVFYCIC